MEIMRCRHVYVVPGCTIHKLKAEQILAGVTQTPGTTGAGESTVGGGSGAPTAFGTLFSDSEGCENE